ncbi:MAG: GNAT family N-acetyltransferase [Ilumatobacteraceae bacterium]
MDGVDGLDGWHGVTRLGAGDLALIAEIDRAEHQTVTYSVVDGRLVGTPTAFDVPPWDPTGHGSHSVAHMIEFARPIVEGGAEFLGVFDDRGAIAGIAIVDPSFPPGRAWFALLHVDRRHRRSGVASRLWAAAVECARAGGARTMYVSATPSDSAVGFYLGRGCRLASPAELDERLVALEPDDIHLVADLVPTSAP